MPVLKNDLCNDLYRTTFNKFFSRKHHCRLCGTVMCASQSCCHEFKVHSRDGSKLVTEVKACNYCHSIVQRYHDFNLPCQSEILLDVHGKINSLKSNVDENLEKFNERLVLIQLSLLFIV